MAYPHCDARILHAPNTCRFCDQHPEWQRLRQAWGIAFTGEEPVAGGLPCPADLARPPGTRGDHRRWAGNVATSQHPVGESAASHMLYDPPPIATRPDLATEEEGDTPAFWLPPEGGHRWWRRLLGRPGHKNHCA